MSAKWFDNLQRFFFPHRRQSLRVRGIERNPLVKRDAGTLLRDARDLLAGHFEIHTYIHTYIQTLFIHASLNNITSWFSWGAWFRTIYRIKHISNKWIIAQLYCLEVNISWWARFNKFSDSKLFWKSLTILNFLPPGEDVSTVRPHYS
jgi:hypothetical protein